MSVARGIQLAPYENYVDVDPGRNDVHDWVKNLLRFVCYDG